MSTTAVEHLCADIVSVMLEAKAMGYDADVVARQRHPDAHSSVFIQAKAEIWKAEKAAFAATLERTNAQTIEGEGVDVTPTSQALARSESTHDQVVRKRHKQESLLALDEAIRAIHVEFAKAAEAIGKSNYHRLNAGRQLLELRKRIEAGEAGEVKWWEWYESKFVRSRRDAEKVMALARDPEPEAAAEEERDAARKGMKKSRAKRAANVSRTETVSAMPAPASGDAARSKRQAEEHEEPGIEDDLDTEDPENFRTAYLLRVDQAIRFAAYSGPVTEEIVAAAHQVAGAWFELARKLAPPDDGPDIPPMLLRDPNAKATAARAAVEQAILAIGAVAVAEMVVARLAPRERFALADRMLRAESAGAA